MGILLNGDNFTAYDESIQNWFLDTLTTDGCNEEDEGGESHYSDHVSFYNYYGRVCVAIYIATDRLSYLDLDSGRR